VKIQVQQSELARALGAVANVVSSKATLPILSTILFDVQKKELTLAATDLDVSVVTRVDEVDVQSEGRAAIPAAKFVPFVRTLVSSPVTLEVDREHVVVQSGKARLEEPCMDPEDFPTLPKVEDSQSFKVEGSLLVEMIRTCIYATSRDETRPALQGVFWELGDDHFTMVATDGHRLSRVRRTAKIPQKLSRKLIASSGGLQQVMRIAETVDEVTIYLGEHQLSFEMGPTTIHTRLVEGSFPNYEQVLPKNNERKIVCDRETLGDGIRRVKVSADRVTNQIRLTVSGKSMKLSASGTEGSHAEDEVPVEYSGDDISIGFNYGYVEDILKHFKTENLLIALDRPDSAAIFLPGDDGKSEILESDDLCLLMPLRLND
jgi:DNA polymerase-3 subunit beta